MLGSAPRSAPCVCGSSQCPFDCVSSSSQCAHDASKTLLPTFPASEATATDTADALPDTIGTEAPIGGLCELRASTGCTSSVSAMRFGESQMSSDMELCTPLSHVHIPHRTALNERATSLLEASFGVSSESCSSEAFLDMPCELTISTQTQLELAAAADPVHGSGASITLEGVTFTESSHAIKTDSTNHVTLFEEALLPDSVLDSVELNSDHFTMIDRTPRPSRLAAVTCADLPRVAAVSDFDTCSLDGLTFSDMSFAGNAPCAQSSSQPHDGAADISPGSDEAPVCFGFTTARGLAIPEPSEAARKRALLILIDLDKCSDDTEKDIGGPLAHVNDRRVLLKNSSKSAETVANTSTNQLERQSSNLSDGNSADGTTIQSSETIETTELRNECISDAPLIVGFSTARGNAIPPPSEEARKRAAKVFEDDSYMHIAPQRAKTSSGHSVAREDRNAFSSHIPVANSAPLPGDTSCQTDEHHISVGFSTARGKAIPPPSEEAKRRAAALISEDVNEQPEQHTSVGFATARGTAIPPPSEEAMQRANDVLQAVKSTDGAVKPVAGFTSGRGRALAEPSEDAKRRAAEILGRSDCATQDESFTISSPPPRAMPVVKRPDALSKTKSMAGNGTRPFKAPTLLDPQRAPAAMRLRGAALKMPLTARVRTASNVARSVVFDLDAFPAVRISLSALPPPKGGASNASIPEFEAVTVLLGDRLPLATDVWLRNHYVEIVTKLAGYERLRDTLKPHYRHNLLASVQMADTCDCDPTECSAMCREKDCLATRTHSNDQSDIGGTANTMRRPLEMNACKDDGITRPTIDSDIAAAAVPRMDAQSVADQLAYRYEREVHRSQRSVLKRACERDGPAGVLMVLYVAEISRPPAPCAPHRMSLSDGWYRVDAAHDAVLEEHISRGRIRVGTKLAVCCAQIVSDEAVDVLEASARNVLLRIHGNATRPAPWHARLGLQVRTGGPPLFAIPLAAVRHDGGNVPCVHVRVTQRFPPIYVFERGRGDERWSVAGSAAFEAESLRVFADGPGAEDAPRVRMAVRFRCTPLRSGDCGDATRAVVTIHESSPDLHARVCVGAALALYNLRPVGAARTAGGILDANTRYLSGYAGARVVVCEPGVSPGRPPSPAEADLGLDIDSMRERDEAVVTGWLLSAQGEYVWLLPARAAGMSSVGIADVLAVRKMRRLPPLAEPASSSTGLCVRVAITDAEFVGRDPRMGFGVFVAQEHSVLSSVRRPVQDVLAAGRVAHVRALVLSLTGHGVSV